MADEQSAMPQTVEFDAFIDGAKRGEFDHLLTADLRAALARRTEKTT